MAAKSPAEDELERKLGVLIRRAPELIAVGVTSVSIDGLSATLAPPPPAPAVAPRAQPPAKRHIDPMRDASTYPGGRVPGFTREDLPNG